MILPTAPVATGVQTTVGSLTWGAATDPRDSGVVGCDIDRPEGTALGSVGLVTSYEDTSVDPATPPRMSCARVTPSATSPRLRTPWS